jgi:hypothetical protein
VCSLITCVCGCWDEYGTDMIICSTSGLLQIKNFKNSPVNFITSVLHSFSPSARELINGFSRKFYLKVINSHCAYVRVSACVCTYIHTHARARAHKHSHMCVCVCVCVCERERERQRGNSIFESFTKICWHSKQWTLYNVTTKVS